MVDPAITIETVPEAPVATDVADVNGDGAYGFDDFVARQGYQYGPQFLDAQALQQNPQFAPGGEQYAQGYALAAAELAVGGYIEEGSVAINQTVNTAVLALAEADPDDPAQGQIHYVAFVEGATPRTYIFTENVTVGPDGSLQTEMSPDGQGWAMFDTEERAAYEALVDQFAGVAGIESGQAPSILAEFEAQSGRDLAVGGVENRGGEYEIRHEDGRAGVASAAELNDTTAVEIESSYGPQGDNEIRLSVFRENAEGMVQEAGSSAALGHDNVAKHDAFAGMDPGIKTLQP